MLWALFIKTVTIAYHYQCKIIHRESAAIKHLQYSWHFSPAITTPGTHKNGYGFTCKQGPDKIAGKRINDIRIIIWLEPSANGDCNNAVLVHLPNSISLPRESLLIWFTKTGDEEFLVTEQDEIVNTEIIIIMKYVFMIESFKMK
jgi:hypothetical protein